MCVCVCLLVSVCVSICLFCNIPVNRTKLHDIKDTFKFHMIV